jgi:hypothetical protein
MSDELQRALRLLFQSARGEFTRRLAAIAAAEAEVPLASLLKAAHAAGLREAA